MNKSLQLYKNNKNLRKMSVSIKKGGKMSIWCKKVKKISKTHKKGGKPIIDGIQSHCSVCFDSFETIMEDKRTIMRCPSGNHFYCSQCFEIKANTDCDEAYADPGQWDGRAPQHIRCAIDPTCRHGNDPPGYSMKNLSNIVSLETYEYIKETISRVKASKDICDFTSNEEGAKILVCPRCLTGPKEKYNCSMMLSHHGIQSQHTQDNSCNVCGFISDKSDDWITWNSGRDNCNFCVRPEHILEAIRDFDRFFNGWVDQMKALIDTQISHRPEHRDWAKVQLDNIEIRLATNIDHFKTSYEAEKEEQDSPESLALLELVTSERCVRAKLSLIDLVRTRTRQQNSVFIDATKSNAFIEHITPRVNAKKEELQLTRSGITSRPVLNAEESRKSAKRMANARGVVNIATGVYNRANSAITKGKLADERIILADVRVLFTTIVDEIADDILEKETAVATSSGDNAEDLARATEIKAKSNEDKTSSVAKATLARTNRAHEIEPDGDVNILEVNKLLDNALSFIVEVLEFISVERNEFYKNANDELRNDAESIAIVAYGDLAQALVNKAKHRVTVAQILYDSSKANYELDRTDANNVKMLNDHADLTEALADLAESVAKHKRNNADQAQIFWRDTPTREATNNRDAKNLEATESERIAIAVRNSARESRDKAESEEQRVALEVSVRS